MLPDGTCALGAVDQTVATAAPMLDQLPPLPTQPFELADLAAPPIREFLAASSPHPPPLYLLLQSFRN